MDRFNRLAMVLFIAWAAYCLFVRPIRLAGEGADHYERLSRECFRQYTPGPDQDKCIADEKLEFESGLMTGFGEKYDKPGQGWSYGWYFRTEGLWIIAMILIPSVVIYGFLRGLIWTARWVWGA